MTLSQTLITAIGVVLASGGAAWWARQGTHEVSSNTLALGLLQELRQRVRQMELDNTWRDACTVLREDYIDVLRNHINDGTPPPPPVRPSYPPRPQS